MLQTVIAPRLNFDFRVVKKAIKERNDSTIRDIVGQQITSFEKVQGNIQTLANLYIATEVPTNSLGENTDSMIWLVKTAMEYSPDIQLCIGAGNVEPGLRSYYDNGGKSKPIVNSANYGNLDEICALRGDYDFRSILVVNDDMVARAGGDYVRTAQTRVDVAKRLVTPLRDKGFSDKDILLDPGLESLSLCYKQLRELYKFLELVKGDSELKGLSVVAATLPEQIFYQTRAIDVISQRISGAFAYEYAENGMDTLMMDPAHLEFFRSHKIVTDYFNAKSCGRKQCDGVLASAYKIMAGGSSDVGCINAYMDFVSQLKLVNPHDS